MGSVSSSMTVGAISTTTMAVDASACPLALDWAGAVGSSISMELFPTGATLRHPAHTNARCRNAQATSLGSGGFRELWAVFQYLFVPCHHAGWNHELPAARRALGQESVCPRLSIRSGSGGFRELWAVFQYLFVPCHHAGWNHELPAARRALEQESVCPRLSIRVVHPHGDDGGLPELRPSEQGHCRGILRKASGKKRCDHLFGP